MAKKTKFYSEGLGLVPVSADPASPAQGQMQYSDGTARAEGLWRYNGTEWVRLGGGGAIISDWVDFTPTGEQTTNVTYSGRYRRVGGVAEIQFKAEYTGATNPSSNIRFDVPAGLTVDDSKLSGEVDSRECQATGYLLDTGSARYEASCLYQDSLKQFLMVRHDIVGSSIRYASMTDTQPTTLAAGDEAHLTVSVPIVGWETGILPNEISEGVTRITKLSRSNVITLPDNSFTKLPFDAGSIVYDTTAMYNATLDRVEIQETGYYDIKCRMSLADSPFVNRNLIMRVLKNGTPAIADGVEVTAQNNTSEVSNSEPAVYLQAGDYIEIQGYQNDVNGTTSEDVSSYDLVIAKRNDLRSQITPAETVAARYTTDAGTSFLNATTTTVVFEDKDFDTHNAYNPSTGVYTAPISGKYMVRSLISFNNAPIDNGETFQNSIYVNGSQKLLAVSQANGTTSWIETVDSDEILHLNAGDTLEIKVYQNSGSTVSLIAGSTRNTFSIIKVGN